MLRDSVKKIVNANQEKQQPNDKKMLNNCPTFPVMRHAVIMQTMKKLLLGYN